VQEVQGATSTRSTGVLMDRRTGPAPKLNPVRNPTSNSIEKMIGTNVVTVILFFLLNQKCLISFSCIPLSFKPAVITTANADRISARKPFTHLKSEPEDETAELDLNLEEMFEM